MKLEKIKSTTKIVNSARPLFYKGTNGKAVLLLHGYRGVVNEMQYLAERLHQAGFSVVVPRLPGHGTNGTDFLQTGRRDWLRRAFDAYTELKNTYETVYAAGLSMGGLLTLILASHFPIERIALAAPALISTNKLIYLSPLLQYVMPHSYIGHEETSDDPDRQLMSKEYWSYRFGHQVYNLFRLQLMARRCLPKVHASILTIVSHSDNSVPLKAADMIERKTPSTEKKRIELQNSSHLIVNDSEREKVADEIIDWFS